ncbi:DNA mismatch repair protein Mlh3 isoform X2 [Salminus brasiliensis]|uniref:DNA mismatch repair protein Mlh3 isoform X2 n=1 Tax=Salminus brasiliensis TaxID=930266 RepID=UPI003B830C05
MIRTLSKEVQAKLRSGIAIFSLQQCVEELLLNSIDAGATCIAVKIDIEACKIQVIDNGSGMGREDMDKVGIRYCTSKCSSLEDLEDLRFYGFRGEAIASIASLATLVEISSRTKASVKTFVKAFNEGKASAVCEAQDTRPSAGTTVLICNFFHNMPVRRKRMDSALEVERLRQRVEAISLMHPSVSFSVKKDCSGTMLVQLPKARNTYYRFVQIHGLARAQKLREVNYAYGQFQMTGHIGREGHYNNSLQFLFVNSRLLLKTRIHKLLNCFLRKLSSSSVQNNSPNTSSVISSPKQRGGADLHGIYVINLKCHYSEYDVCLEPAKSLIEFRDWDSVLFCIEEGVKAFLTKENLVAEFTLSDVQNFASVFSDPAGSPCRNDKEQAPGACPRNNEDDLKDTRTLVSMADKPDVVRDQVVQSFEQIFDQASSNAESTESSDAEPEKDGQNVDKPLQQSGCFTDKAVLEDCPVVKGCNLQLSVNNNTLTHCVNTKVAGIGHNDAQDSLRRFTEPNLCCAPKRKLSLLHAQNLESGAEPKVTKVTPRSKLTLSFEIGSLDKFKRMYGKESETKGQAVHSQITDILRPPSSGTSFGGSAVPASHAGTSLLSIEAEQAEKRNMHNFLLKDSLLTRPAYTKTQCSASASTRTRISLAAKLSHLKCDQVQRKKPCEGNLEDTKNEKTHDIEALTTSRERFTKSPPLCDLLESSTGSSKQTVMVENSETDGADEPMFTVPSLHNPSTHSSNAGDTQMASTIMTSPEPTTPSGQITKPASQHVLAPSKTVNEDQALDERQGRESDGPAPVSSDWLTRYDDSLGKLVYINQVTGLSKYEAPSREVTPVPCSTDVTNMAVSVISKTEGLQGPGSLSALFSEWNNPVFIRPPQVAVDVTSGQGEGLAVKIHNILFPYRFTKDMIHSMKVIHQVDKKFLACLIDTTDQKTTETSESRGNLLVLVDQHAAHERVRLEGLLTESYEDDPDTPGKKRLCSSNVVSAFSKRPGSRDWLPPDRRATRAPGATPHLFHREREHRAASWQAHGHQVYCRGILTRAHCVSAVGRESEEHCTSDSPQRPCFTSLPRSN